MLPTPTASSLIAVHSIMPTDSIMKSSQSHSFNHGWQNAVLSHMLLPLLTVAVLIIFHPAHRQHQLLANHHVGLLPSARRPLAILPPPPNDIHPQASPPP